MDPAFEERKLQYIQTIEAAYMPQDKNYWQHPPPIYHLTSECAAGNNISLTTGESVIFKKNKNEGMLVTVMIVVAALLIYMVGKKEFSFLYIAFLLILLIVVLPVLLNSKAMIRVSRESILLYKDNKEIKWEQIVRTYIKEIREEHTSYFFIVHYYDPPADEFRSIETKLDKSISPKNLSAAIEAYKPA